MPKFFPSADNRISTRRFIFVTLLVLSALAWVAYSFLNNDPRWANYLVMSAFITLIVSFNIADSFWPVVSIDNRSVTQHRCLWLGKRYRREDVDSLCDDGQFLYVGGDDAKRVIDLGKLGEVDRELIRKLIRQADHTSAG